jgi:hypothetical protein
MKLRDAVQALERAEEREKQAEAKTRAAKAALKRAKKERHSPLARRSHERSFQAWKRDGSQSTWTGWGHALGS